MDLPIVLFVILVLVAIGIVWRLRRAGVERVAPPWDAARAGSLETASQGEMGPGEPNVGAAAGPERVSSSAADERPPAESRIVTVLATYDYAELLVAKSLLEGADIPYYAKGEAVQNLIGGQMWGGHNFAMGPVQLQVPATLADEARTLLENPEPLEE